MGRDYIKAELCNRCSSPIDAEQKLCNYCGKPTQFMTFEERAEYEVAQYRAYRESVAATA